MILKADLSRGKKLAELLYHKFLNEGIHGRRTKQVMILLVN